MDEKCLDNVYLKSFLKWLNNYGDGIKTVSAYDIKVVENPPHNNNVICMFKNKNNGTVFFIKTGFNVEEKYPNMENDMIISFISLYNMIKLISSDYKVNSILQTMRKKKLYPIISVSFNKTIVSSVLEIVFSVGLMYIPDLRRIRVKVADGVYVMRKKNIPVEYDFKVNIANTDNIINREAVSSSRFIVDLNMINRINIENYGKDGISISYADIRNLSYVLSKFFTSMPSTIILPYISVKESAFVEASRNLFSFIKPPQGLKKIIFTSIRGSGDVVVNGEIVIDNVNKHLCQHETGEPRGDDGLLRLYIKCADETAQKIEKLGVQTTV